MASADDAVRELRYSSAPTVLRPGTYFHEGDFDVQDDNGGGDKLMGRRACKDCQKCTRSSLRRLGGALGSVGVAGLTGGMSVAARAGKKLASATCPICKHTMVDHAPQGAVVVIAGGGGAAPSNGAPILNAKEMMALTEARRHYPRSVATAQNYHAARAALEKAGINEDDIGS